MGFKRGQAAMEYLMTYGWAILVIVIVLAALLYLGIFNLNPPEVCTMPAGMTCTTSYLKAGTAAGYDVAGSSLTVALVNGLQKTIIVTDIGAGKTGSTVACGDVFAPATSDCPGFSNVAGGVNSSGVNIPLGSSVKFTLKPYDDATTPLAMAFESGEAFSGKITVKYYFKDEGRDSPRTITGNVYAKAG